MYKNVRTNIRADADQSLVIIYIAIHVFKQFSFILLSMFQNDTKKIFQF